jgi:site-specific recombinase XerD
MNAIVVLSLYVRRKDQLRGSARCHLDWLEHGRRRSRTFASKADAEHFRESLHHGIIPPPPIKPAPAPLTIDDPTFSAALNAALNRFHLRPESIGTTDKHGDDTVKQVKRTFRLAGIHTLEEITDDAVGAGLRKLLEIGRAMGTAGHHQGSCKTFTSWCERKGILPRDPLRGMKRFRSSTDPRHVRRAFTIHEFARLFETTMASDREIYRIAPRDRAMLYLAALVSSLRALTLRKLRVGQFDFSDPAAPVIYVEARQEKAKRQLLCRLPAKYAPFLQEYLAGKTPTAQALRMPKSRCDVVRMLKRDLKAAGIDYCKVIREEGEPVRRIDVLDFHSLRVTWATWLDEQGVELTDLQNLIGHSTPGMTKLYIRSTGRTDRLRQHIEKFPSLPLSSPQMELFPATGASA